MSRVGALWTALTDAEREEVSRTLRVRLGERGSQFIIAIAREASPGASASEPHADPEPDDRCHGCGQASDWPLEPLWDFNANTLLMLGPTCWRERAFARSQLPGDVQQPFPTPSPLEDR